MQIAIITARGGSKRIPRKNIKPFLGKPMIGWAIEAAKSAGCFNKIIVSTDDTEIAAIAESFGAEIPFLRPSALADDFAPAHKAARHALEWAMAEYGGITSFCHLYPTVPLLCSESLRECMDVIAGGAYKAAWLMTRIGYPVYQIMIRESTGDLQYLFPQEKVQMRSQDMPEALVDVGQAYCFDVQYFLQHEMQIGQEVTAVLVPADTAIDIDTEEDWHRAERLATLLTR